MFRFQQANINDNNLIVILRIRMESDGNECNDGWMWTNDMDLIADFQLYDIRHTRVDPQGTLININHSL